MHSDLTISINDMNLGAADNNFYSYLVHNGLDLLSAGKSKPGASNLLEKKSNI